MKALIRLNAAQRQMAQKEIQQMADKQMAEAQKKLQVQMEQEQNDIATRAMYLTLIACQQVGLSARTLRRIRDAIPMVTERYADYKTDGLADVWAQMMLTGAGVEVPETEEKQ